MKEFLGIKIPVSLDEIVTPQNTALIVYDMQAGITRQIRNGPEITENVARVLGSARTAGLRVFFTRHMSLPRELMGAFQYRTAMAWQRVDSPDKVNPLFLRDSPAFQITAELGPRPSEGIVDKIAMSAFEEHIWRWRCGTAAFAASSLLELRWRSELIRRADRQRISVSGRYWFRTPAVLGARKRRTTRWLH